jgi:hypothetical protein
MKQCPDTYSFKVGNRLKSLVAKSALNVGKVHFPPRILQQVPNVLCCVHSGIVMEENHTFAKKTRMLAPDGLL